MAEPMRGLEGGSWWRPVITELLARHARCSGRRRWTVPGCHFCLENGEIYLLSSPALHRAKLVAHPVGWRAIDCLAWATGQVCKGSPSQTHTCGPLKTAPAPTARAGSELGFGAACVGALLPVGSLSIQGPGSSSKLMHSLLTLTAVETKPMSRIRMLNLSAVASSGRSLAHTARSSAICSAGMPSRHLMSCAMMLASACMPSSMASCRHV